MGQIFDRISRFIKTELNFSSSKKKIIFAEEDEELRRIIEELGNDAKKQQPNNSSSSSNNYTKTENSNNTELHNALLLFGLNINSSKDEIKSAYKKKMMQYHPDRVSHLGADYTEAAKKKTVEFNQAYQVLKKYGKV